jgi:hypothetical protein
MVAAVSNTGRCFMPIPVTGQTKPTPPLPARDGHVAAVEAERLRREQDIDDELEQSFPASDPPSWTMGVASGNRSDTLQQRARGAAGEAPSPPAAH